MSLGDDLMKMSISGSRKAADPVADATRKGRVPTLGEVKRSLKVCAVAWSWTSTQIDSSPDSRQEPDPSHYADGCSATYVTPTRLKDSIERPYRKTIRYVQALLPRKYSPGL